MDWAQAVPPVSLRWAQDVAGARVVAALPLDSQWLANHLLVLADGRELVLRRWARPGWEVDDPDLNAAREALVLQRLADTPVPVGPLVAALAEIHAVDPEGVPPYRRYYEPERLAVPSWAADRDVWERAIALAHEPPPGLPERFIHRDYHPGNTLWEGAELTGIVDWTTGSRGPGAVDLGHLRWNLVVDHGQRVADALLPHPEHHPYYDVVTVLDVLPELDPTDTHAELLRLEDHVARALAEL